MDQGRRIRIVSDGIGRNLRVVDVETGEDIRGVRSVSWRCEAGMAVPEVTIGFTRVEVELKGVTDRWAAGLRPSHRGIWVELGGDTGPLEKALGKALGNIRAWKRHIGQEAGGSCGECRRVYKDHGQEPPCQGCAACPRPGPDAGLDADWAAINREIEGGLLTFADWQASRAYSEGYLVYPTNPARQELYYRCQTAGVSGAVEPAWPEAAGATVEDGTCVWTCMALPADNLGKPTVPLDPIFCLWQAAKPEPPGDGE